MTEDPVILRYIEVFFCLCVAQGQGAQCLSGRVLD